MLVVVGATAIYVLRSRPAAEAVEVSEMPAERRSMWTMPPLALLERPAWSPARKATMLLMRGYLVIAVALLVVKTVQLGH